VSPAVLNCLPFVIALAASAFTPGSPIQVRRIYDEPRECDGTRLLVDRLWPRGVSKERARLESWIKEIAPSTELRKRYAYTPERFDESRTHDGEEIRQRWG